MSLDLDFTDDYLSLDAPETIAHVSRALDGDTTQEDVVAHRLPLRRAEAAASGGVYTAGDLIWLIQNDLLDIEPKPGDWITDADETRWVVQSASYSRITESWQLTARDLLLAADLRDTADLYRATYEADEAGSAVPSYSAEETELPCRIQETAGEVTEERGKDTIRRRYTVYFADRITVQAGDQIRTEDSIYEVTDYLDPDRIDQLMAVNCVRKDPQE